MSDGPYRTLPMSPKWKQVAKRAYVPSFSTTEISEALERAAERDCRAEISASLVRRVTSLIVGPDEPSLFDGLPVADLNALHRACISTLEHGLVNSPIDALENGLRGLAALQWAAEASVSDRLLARIRQVEEHMHRKASDHRARATRSRLEEAHGVVDVSGIALRLLRVPEAPVRPTTVVYSGLDDGTPR